MELEKPNGSGTIQGESAKEGDTGKGDLCGLLNKMPSNKSGELSSRESAERVNHLLYILTVWRIHD